MPRVLERDRDSAIEIRLKTIVPRFATERGSSGLDEMKNNMQAILSFSVPIGIDRQTDRQVHSYRGR